MVHVFSIRRVNPLLCSVLALVLAAPGAQAGGRHALETGVGIAAGLLILNEAAKAMKSQDGGSGRTRYRDTSDDERPRSKTRNVKRDNEDNGKSDETETRPDSGKKRQVVVPFPDQPRWNGIPDAPLPRQTPTPVVRGPAQIAAAFGAGPAPAAAMFQDLAADRFSAGTGLSPTEIRQRAADAYIAEPDLVALVNRSSAAGKGLRDDRVQALIIGETWRQLDAAPASDPGLNAARVDATFKFAARQVLLQTQAATEAARLTTSGDTLVGAVNDVIARGGQHPELRIWAADRGRSLLGRLEAEVPAIAAAETDGTMAGTVASYELRRRLTECVAFRLTAVTQIAPPAQPFERASMDGKRGGGWLATQVAMDAKTSCVPLLAPVAPQNASDKPARKAEAVIPPGRAVATALAGVPHE